MRFYSMGDFGAVLTSSGPLLCWLHIASLIWGILAEVLPGHAPVTGLELARGKRGDRALPLRRRGERSGLREDLGE